MCIIMFGPNITLVDQPVSAACRRIFPCAFDLRPVRSVLVRRSKRLHRKTSPVHYRCVLIRPIALRIIYSKAAGRCRNERLSSYNGINGTALPRSSDDEELRE